MGVRLATAWRVLGASARGTSHVAAGTPCQDAHHVVTDGELLVLAVADGAGSAPLGGEGATLASCWAAELTARRLRARDASAGGPCPGLTGVLRDVMARTRDRLRRDAYRRDVPLRDLATTLVLCAMTRDELGVAQVGDGAAVVRTTGGADWEVETAELSVVAAGERGEYLNETTFLTSRGWRRDLRAQVMPATNVDAVALLTDGVQLLALDLATGGAHAPFFEPLFAYAADPAGDAADLDAFLRSPRVCARTDDDKTLVLAVRVPDG